MPDAEDVSLSRRLTLAILVPVALLLLVGAILAYQITRMREEAALVDQTDRVIATSFEAVKQILDQESSFRGYLLTREPEFLEPFHDVNPRRTLRELAELVSDNPRESQRARNLADGYERWLAEVEPVMRGGNFELARALPAMQLRHRRMAATRQLARSIIEEQYTLRATRAKEAEEAAHNAEMAFFGCFFFAALSLAFVSRNQLKRVSSSYRAAFERERTARLGVENAEWVRQGEVELARALQGELSAEQIGRKTLELLVEKTGADVGAVYAAEDEVYRRCAAYGLSTRPDEPERFVHGEGLVGRAAAGEARIVKRDLPPEYLRVRSGTGEHLPAEVVVVPATVDGQVQAVLELGFLKVIDDRSLDLLDRVHDVVGAAMRSADYRKRLRDLLKRTQEQAEQLQTQQEELRVQNEELEEQSQALQEAQRRLELQQTELEQTNEDLKLHTDLLERRNFDLSRAQREIEEKAGEVARANQYKSEFLANMSHELRTPLNSSLILAKLLADNKDGNLKAEQVRYAETIYSAGNDLLSLINDILDLSKIEAGKMDVDAAPIALSRLTEPIARTFEPIAQQKKVAFSLWIEPALDRIETDAAKVQQILNNLLSNAFKFTEQGHVELKVLPDSNAVRFEVSDTGIGIPPERQALIFDAFRQADGSIARRFGGTGLGLSISRDLARLLGGDIDVTSTQGQGSTFVLTLPLVYQPRTEQVRGREPSVAPAVSSAPPTVRPLSRPAPAMEPIPDDRGNIDPGKRLILVIEDDPRFAAILVDLAHEMTFQCVAAFTGEEGLELARKLAPSALILDMNLPDCSGLVVLDRLKQNPLTRHIPVHVVSVADYSHAAREMGAVGYMLKPTRREELAEALRRLESTFTRGVRRVLVIEDDPVQRESICLLLGGDSTETVAVETVQAALAQLRANTFDCVVTDLTLPDGSGYDLLETMAGDETCSFPPVVVYTGRSLAPEEEQRLRRFSDSIIVKGARSPERLLDEVTLFLHQVESELPAERQRMLREARDREAIFDGRKILVAEDDVRNIFALSSVLEPKGAKIEIARNGLEAIQALERDSEIDMVLMDIMMPEMDGLTAMREIRKRPAWNKLPIIALTAKAMRDDMEKCMQAGANDYASKPLDIERLLSLVRVWMPR